MTTYDLSRLDSIRKSVAEHPELMGSLARLVGDAEGILAAPIPSVVDKKQVPPSGDKHDFMSLGTYWWPNPETPDGLPYIRRDGRRNPEGDELDVHRVRYVWMSIRTLGLAWYFTRDERFAEHAVRMVRSWFIDAATKMNPHLEYAQAIPGVCAGRDIGIIDSSLVAHHLADGLTLLQDAPGWRSADQIALEHWLADFLNWLLTSENGKGEARQHNNHGTWYATQVMVLSCYLPGACNYTDIARDAMLSAQKFIASQIEPDGSQPHELSRTLSQTYTAMNLDSFAVLAALGKRVDVDLWHYETEDGRSLRKAIEWLLPYALEEKPWEYEQIKPFNQAGYVSLFRQAGLAYNDDRYLEAARRAAGAGHEALLLY